MHRAVISVIGKDKIGIIADISMVLKENQINILDISQTIMQDIFTMIMLVDVSKIKIEFTDLSSRLEDTGKNHSLLIKIQHEDIFNSMHKL